MLEKQNKKIVAIPTFNISDAFIFSPKSDTDGSEVDVKQEKKVFAQNVNQSQNEFGYLWSSAGVQLNKESQNKTAISVANYVFENILEDKSTIDQHSDVADLFIADRIDYQSNTKHLGNTNHKGVFFFLPIFNNSSNSVSLQIYGQSTYKLLKRSSNGELIDLEPNDIISNNLYMIAFDYKESIPCFILYEMLSEEEIHNTVGKYNVSTKMDLVNTRNAQPSVGQSILNTVSGNLIADKVGENSTQIIANAIYTVYRIENNKIIHYHETKLKSGDIIFVASNGKFYWFNGKYLSEIGADGKYVFDAYTDDGTTIVANTDESDLVYVKSLSGDRQITLSGTPTHMQKFQMFLNITTVGEITFTNVTSWLDNVQLVLAETGVYAFCFLYDANLQKWIGNTQGVYK